MTRTWKLLALGVVSSALTAIACGAAEPTPEPSEAPLPEPEVVLSVDENTSKPLAGYLDSIPPHGSTDAPTEGAFDVIGSMDPTYPKPPNRPLYPYKATEYWYGHDADSESWGDLLELPYVKPGWFATADLTGFKAHVDANFTSAGLLAGTFPGNPVTIGSASLDTFLSPKFNLGYRYEHGLGEIQLGYQYFGMRGAQTLGGFDPFGPATLATDFRGHVFDLDFCYLEFNSEGLTSLPFISPVIKFPGRIGLGRPLTSGRLGLPLEVRWLFGLRGASMFYDSVAQGPTLREEVLANFNGGGLHFALELNQRLMRERNVFLHTRLEGSGMWGVTSQTFSRSQAAVPAGPITSAFGKADELIGVPTAHLEGGLSWVPNWPHRSTRVTLAYAFEEWFHFANTDNNGDAFLVMHGVLLRAEWNF